MTDDPWVADGVARNAAALRESMRVASERQAKLARRASTPGSSTTGKATVDALVAYLESPSPDRFEQLFSDAALWVDHRDDDESVVAGVSRRLDGATVTACWTAAGRLVLSGPHGERTVTPRSRDTTLRALATMVGPEVELQQWVGGPPSDTLAIVVLHAEAWAAVAAARSARARDAQFRRVHARSTIFG